MRSSASTFNFQNPPFFLRGGAVGWGTALQARRSQVRFPMVSLEFFIDIILPAALWPWTRISLNTNEYQEYSLGGGMRPVRRDDHLTISMCRLSWNLGTWTSWNAQGLSRPVQGLLYPCFLPSWSSSCLRLLPRVPVTSILSSIFPPITCFIS